MFVKDSVLRKQSRAYTKALEYRYGHIDSNIWSQCNNHSSDPSPEWLRNMNGALEMLLMSRLLKILEQNET